MSTPRRRVIRPTIARPNQDRERQRQRLTKRLDDERAVLARWMSRLRRAFHTVERAQRSINRLERRLKQEEGK